MRDGLYQAWSTSIAEYRVLTVTEFLLYRRVLFQLESLCRKSLNGRFSGSATAAVTQLWNARRYRIARQESPETLQHILELTHH